MISLLLAAAAAQLTPRQAAEQQAFAAEAQQWVATHQAELRAIAEHQRQVRALTYDQALIIYDQCLAHAAAALDDVPPDTVFGQALARCMPLRVELLSGRPTTWFFGFRDLDTAKRAAFPALTRQWRERMAARADAGQR